MVPQRCRASDREEKETFHGDGGVGGNGGIVVVGVGGVGGNDHRLISVQPGSIHLLVEISA